MRNQIELLREQSVAYWEGQLLRTDDPERMALIRQRLYRELGSSSKEE